MKTVWDHSTHSDTINLVHQLRDMSNGFFRINNFIVLPLNGHANEDGRIVTIPDLAYKTIPHVWKRVLKAGYSSWDVADPTLVDEMESLLKTSEIGMPNYESTKEIWTKAETEVLKTITSLVPNSLGKTKKLIIHPSRFGTNTSFNLVGPQGDIIELFLREGQGIHSIAEAILSATVRPGLEEDFDALWTESEMLVDWLVTKSQLAKVLKKYQRTSNFIPTMKATRVKQNSSLLQKSEDFYAHLGLPKDNASLVKREIPNLSLKEKIVWELLHSNPGKIVGVSDIGKIVSGDEFDFSLYAVSKFIQRLRDKLETNGISGSAVQTIRGQGFTLREF